MSLRLPDSGAPTGADGRRTAASASRNAAPILAVLRDVLPAEGRLLEIAAGTGQHAAEFAAAFPGLDWQSSDVNPENMASIAAWVSAPNQRPPVVLDACAAGWGAAWHPLDAVLVVNLLHLVATQAVESLLSEVSGALGPGGVFVIYGPFLRDGRATSEGDAAFDASLRAQDSRIGYKDLDWVEGQLNGLGLAVTRQEMPANNVMVVASKAR